VQIPSEYKLVLRVLEIRIKVGRNQPEPTYAVQAGKPEDGLVQRKVSRRF
jgi:hypothetical protein